ncbi:Mg2+ transporter [Colletotrichum higginsianum]|nr:Mg2+ transporter [Colletotrichum higginsianum]
MAGRAERWDRDRFMYERERDRGYPDDRVPPPPRIPDDRSHYDERDDYRPHPAVAETTRMSVTTEAPMTADTAAPTMTTL